MCTLNETVDLLLSTKSSRNEICYTCICICNFVKFLLINFEPINRFLLKGSVVIGLF